MQPVPAAESETVIEDVTVLEGRRGLAALSLAFSLLSLLAGVFVVGKYGVPAGKDGGAFVRVVVLAVLGGGFGAWWFSRVSRRDSDLQGRLRVTADALLVRDQLLVKRADLASGQLSPSPDGAVVHLARRGLGPSIDLRVSSVKDGRALLHALGLDATQVAAEFTVQAPSRAQLRRRLYGLYGAFGALVTGVVGAFVAGKHGLIGFGGVAAILTLGLLGYLTSVLLFAKSGTAVVGADGVYLRWLWQARFVPLHELTRAEVVAVPTGLARTLLLVRMHKKTGEPIDVPAALGSGYGGSPLAQLNAATLAERVNAAIEGTAARPAIEDPAGALVRGERSAAEWMAALRDLRNKVPTFREPGRLFDRLWDVLEDAQAEPARRAAAAVALSPALDDEGRARLRVAARAAVAPKLRVALEAAAAGDDDELTQALEDVAVAEAQGS